MKIFADLHVHIGKARNKPVKITASKDLTLEKILTTAYLEKGLNVIGIVDAASPLVLDEIIDIIKKGELVELDKGGYLYKNSVILFLGSELETLEKNGVAHSLVFFPKIIEMIGFSKIMEKYIKNINLSSQKASINARELLKIVEDMGGVLIPAHVFTPHKSFYACYNRLLFAFENCFDRIKFIELGLSADSFLADHLRELEEKVFLSNSDAHSLEKIGREFNEFYAKDVNDINFETIFHEKEIRITANFGLNPKLGKYHRTRCENCGFIAESEPPVTYCPVCKNNKVTVGVLDRVYLLKDKEYNKPAVRPPYFYNYPLELIPGIGKKTKKLLLDKFHSEINVMHLVEIKEIEKNFGKKIAEKISKVREGKLDLISGGGGIYGKLIID
ncbi:TIGR00375 family protein [Thermovenabulum sp.]|uniref:TIGR00375 family protein n=1 Tax=Thermovenabulum sp. TaxID=3100335 RepID=UPI003C7A0B09